MLHVILQATYERDAAPSLNAEQLEDVDNAGDETNKVCWTSGESHQRVATADSKIRIAIVRFTMLLVSYTQLLFCTRLEPGAPRALATRHEHDGIVWSFVDDAEESENGKIQHTHTLNAFGYIQVCQSEMKLFIF